MRRSDESPLGPHCTAIKQADPKTKLCTAQPHAFKMRTGHGDYPGLVWLAQDRLKDFSWVIDDGVLKVHFKRLITFGDYFAAHGIRSAGKPPASDKPAMRALSLLVKTTKMGAYSANLPAGPVHLKGCCPASVVGWADEAGRADKKALPVLKSGVSVDPDNWLCTGCYALKNTYGNPSTQLIQAVRREVTLKLLRRSGAFADMMERAIRLAQIKSIRAIARAVKAGTDRSEICHPEYFRIHDSGDFGFAQTGVAATRYQEEWFEICRRCSVPVTWTVPPVLGADPGLVGKWDKGTSMTLPAIRFWAPTRTWILAGVFSPAQLAQVPSNLTLRPSSLSFGAPPPSAPYLSAGATSANIDLIAPQGGGTPRVKVDWVCPAMLPPRHKDREKDPHWAGRFAPDVVGGTEWSEEKKGWVEGACGRSSGPDPKGTKKDRPIMKGGHGCRYCWDHPHNTVAYLEH
jgi:hypothetical protein